MPDFKPGETETEYYSQDESKWVLIQHDLGENIDTLWLDFYTEDEDGEMEDDGNSVEIPIEEYRALSFEPSYENFAKYREERG